MSTAGADLTIAACGNPFNWRDGTLFMHHSFGRVLELLAPRVRQIQYFGSEFTGDRAERFDFPLPHSNIQTRSWGSWSNTVQAMQRPDRLLRAYWRMVSAADAIVIRGTIPLIWALHLMARRRRVRIVHWMAANVVSIIRSEQRGYGRFQEKLGLAFAHSERWLTRWAMRVNRSYMVTSGFELARIYASDRTIGCPSSSTSSLRDFRTREDTCQGDQIRLLFLGFIKVEKGIEYLLRALPRIQSPKPVHVALVGGWDQFPAERQRLLTIIDELAVARRVHWEGYAHYGPELFDQIDRADMLVLPSLSEGTPHVLIEARARSLPVIATTVGGIPDTITDGDDGLLVPPRDPQAIAAAASRMINDGALRRRLIRQGRERVKSLTVEWFSDLIHDLLTLPDEVLVRRFKTQAQA